VKSSFALRSAASNSCLLFQPICLEVSLRKESSSFWDLIAIDAKLLYPFSRFRMGIILKDCALLFVNWVAGLGTRDNRHQSIIIIFILNLLSPVERLASAAARDQHSSGLGDQRAYTTLLRCLEW
jgi:hypothetical protein